MADLVSPIVDIISRLWTCCARHTRYLCKLQQNMDLLRNAMTELKDARNDVLRRVIEAEADPNEPKKRIDSVRGWLERVQIIEGEVEVLLQKADEQLRRATCVGGCCGCPPTNCRSNYKVGKSIAEKIPVVNELKVNGNFEEVTYRLPPSSVQDENLESTVGMDSMFDEVWRLVTSTNDKPVRIMGLHGHGGVGKTTLLKKINNEFSKVSSGHDVVIFVVVSKPVNYEAIQNKIGERLGLSASLQGDGDESSRAQKIFNALRTKNYVLLLDDIWEDLSGDQFDKKRIGIPVHPQGNSSKLIFTTRSKRVCGLMEATHTFQVECLPWEKAWSLFQDKVGEMALNYLSGEGAHELAKDVAKQCGGLPLALITIGRAMSIKKSVQEWRDAIATLQRYASEFKDMRDKVLPRLKLSYDNLPDETEKSCFRYCALFPEDYIIEIDKLVELWIAEGFLAGFKNLDEARDRGHTIIGSLKNACLLDSDEGFLVTPNVKMHDVIRDLAIWIVNDCSSNDDSDNNNKFLVAVGDPCQKWENAERIFWDATGATSGSNHPPTSLNLLTLIIVQKSDPDGYRLPQSFFQHMPLLRVLHLNFRWGRSVFFTDGFPISICELHELVYLNLSGTEITELPVELRKLVKLNFLILYDTNRLTRIPAGLIASLSELQVLDLCSSHNDRKYAGVEDWELKDGPSFSELDGLKQLQQVWISITTFVALEKFLCNRKLQMVCTGLRFEKSSTSSSRRVLDLSNFKSLKVLSIRGFSELEELVLYGSTTDGGLLSKLEILKLDCFPKLNSILWMAAQPSLLRSHFQNLRYIWIAGCDALKDLTWLVFNVENLNTLVVRDCEGLETIIELDDAGVEGGDQTLNTGGGGGVFKRLNFLVMSDLPKLKSICRHALAFPSIKLIQVSKCPELKKLPLDFDSNVNNTLKWIEGQLEWWNELQWKDETIKSKFLPYFNQGYKHRWV